MMQRFSASSFIAGVMLGLIFAGAWFFGGDLTLPSSSSSTLSTSPINSSLPESGAVSVVDQLSGENVAIDSITVPSSGVWVAVREANGNDLGNVLGAARLVGPHTSVIVPLLRPTEPDRSYAVQLYRDDNNEAFDPAINSVYVDFETGARVVTFFATTP